MSTLKALLASEGLENLVPQGSQGVSKGGKRDKCDGEEILFWYWAGSHKMPFPSWSHRKREAYQWPELVFGVVFVVETDTLDGLVKLSPKGLELLASESSMATSLGG